MAWLKVPDSLLVENHLTGKRLVHAVIAISALSICFFGYDQGVMSGVNNSPDYVKLMKLGYFDDEGNVTITNSTRQGGIVAVYYFGTLIGCLFGAYISDKFGRINGVGTGSIIAIIGAALQCSAQNVNWMVGCRFLTGIGTGTLNVIIPVLSAEVAEADARGFFLSIEFTLNIFGVVVAYWLEYGLSYIDGGFSAFRWRFPIAFQIIPLLVLFFSIWFFPESPRWLIKNNERERAMQLLIRMRGEEQGLQEFEEVCAAIDYEDNSVLGSSSYIRLFFGWFKTENAEEKAKLKRLHIFRRNQLVIWLQIIQEWTGIAGITVYQPTIFAQAGFTQQKANWLSGVNNIFYMFSTLISAFTLDRWGRRFTSYWGGIGQGIALFLAGGFSKLQQIHPNQKGYGAASASFVFIYTSIFGATWLEVPWLYPSEIYPLPIRSFGNGMGNVGWSIGNGWLTLLCPVMFHAIAEKTLYIFGASNFIAIAMVWAFYPETANRSLEEIDWLFASDSVLASNCEAEFQRLTEERNLILHHGIIDKKIDTEEYVSDVEAEEV